MEKRSSRHKDLRPQAGIFLDFARPEGAREIFRIWGHGVKDRRELAIPPAIEDPQDFHLGMARCKPGHGAALHAHVTDEVFVAIEGRWEIMWGDEGEHSTILEKFDVIAVPPGI